MVRVTVRPNMTLDVYRGRKTAIQQHSSKSKCLGTNVAFIKRVHCITIIKSILIIIICSISILIIIIIMIIAKHEETAFAFIFEVFIIYRLVISKFPDFSLTFA